MNMAEPLCNLRMIKADYRFVGRADHQSHHCFRITVLPGDEEKQFDIAVENGELFAAELDTLAAIIRSRVVRARIESNRAVF